MWQQIGKFIVDNWQSLLSVLVAVITLIIVCIRKKTVFNLLDNSGYADLVALITQAENLFGPGKGAEKLKYVIETFCSQRNITLNKVISNALTQIIEKILDTPERK